MACYVMIDGTICFDKVRYRCSFFVHFYLYMTVYIDVIQQK